jgi:hypothetical protein
VLDCQLLLRVGLTEGECCAALNCVYVKFGWVCDVDCARCCSCAGDFSSLNNYINSIKVIGVFSSQLIKISASELLGFVHITITVSEADKTVSGGDEYNCHG